MSDILLLENGSDLDLTGNRAHLATDEEAIANQVMIRLRFFFEEWFLDERQGIPYFREILIKNPNLDLVRYLFRTAVATTPGISAVTSLTAEVDPVARKLSVTFAATMDTGAQLVFSPFIIEI